MKTKEELAREYASKQWNNPVIGDRKLTNSLKECSEEDFIAGYEAAQEWIPFGKGVGLPEGLLLYKFDDGSILLSTEDNQPFAVMTHFKTVG